MLIIINMFILIFLTLIVNALVLFLIRKREANDCECSKIGGWKREFVKYYTITSLIVITIVYILPILASSLKQDKIAESLALYIKSNIGEFLLSIFIALGFFNIYFIFRYTKELELSKCYCDTNIYRKLRKSINIYSMVVITIYIITTLLTFLIKVN